jgi:alkaline phosphatase
MKANRIVPSIAVAASLCAAASAHAGEARNVILMIADGAGPTTWLAANQ